MILREWLKELDYQVVQGDLDVAVEEVSYDSRKVGAKGVFVCMKGAKADSHDFISQVVEAGAVALVVERKVEAPPQVTVVQVPCARKALALLSAARFGHPSRKMTTIGVTGTKGKTTTTHMVQAILEAAGKKVGLVGTNGIFIQGKRIPTVNTTPESYKLQEAFAQMVEEGCQYMVMEVSSQGLKMHRVDGIWFDFALFTNITPDHIGPDEHESFEEYLYYKSKIFSQCGVGIMNLDDVHCQQVVKDAACQMYYFSLGQKGDFQGGSIRYVAEGDFVGLEFNLKGIKGPRQLKETRELKVRVGIPGKFNVYNALGAASVCTFLDVPPEKICHGLERVHVDGRMEIAYASERCTVIIDYAHNAVSMESLLSTLREYHPKRLVCVFGCGGNRSKDRRYSMGEIGGRLADFCIITADNSRFERVEDIMADIRGSIQKTGGKFMEIPDRGEAIAYSITHAQPGDMVAIIGKGHEDYQEVGGVRHPFLDRAVVDQVVAGLAR